MTQPPQQPTGMPAAEVTIDEPFVRRLLARQHPEFADLSLTQFAEGWDNVSFRLGGTLLVRLPRRAMAAQLIENEQRWLPRLAPTLPVPIPAPVRIGSPDDTYPWNWSIVPFLDGAPVDEAPLTSPDEVGSFLRALHRAAPSDAPLNAWRGGPLTDRITGYEGRVAMLSEAGRLPDHVDGIWRTALAAPLDAPRVWLHADLHPLNVLGSQGHLSAVIDWGDLCAGDPATDLAHLWSLMSDSNARDAAFAAYGPVSDATMVRARGWAAYFGVVLLASGLVNSPRHAVIGQAMLDALADD